MFLEFGYQRIVVRALALMAVIAAAETVPNFGPLMQLLGGTKMGLLSMVFPSICYLCLRTKELKGRARSRSGAVNMDTEISFKE